MKVAPIICLLLLICNLWVFSQEEDSNTYKDYKQFLETFHSELDEYNEPVAEPDSPYFVTNPEPLPDIFTSIPNAGSNTIYAIGISDPFMEREEGRKLALLRAKSMLAIQKASDIAHISDYYTSENISYKTDEILERYQDLYTIKYSLEYDSTEILIIADTVNRYGESILLIQFTPNSCTKANVLNTISDCMSTEIRYNSHFEVTHRIEITCDNKFGSVPKIENYHFISRRIQDLYEVNSTFRNEPIAPPAYTLRYKSTLEEIPENAHVSILKDGLWNAFVEAIYKHLFVKAKMYATKVKSIGDYHTSTTKNLNREIIRSEQYFRLDKVNILENRMYVNVNFLNE